MTNLEKVYQGLLEGTVTEKDAANVLSSAEVKKSINYLTHLPEINPLIVYSEEDMQFICMVITIAQFIYNNSGDNTGISDHTYDILYSIMESGGNPDIVSVELKANTEKVTHHKYPALRGTLKKIFYLSNEEKRTNPSRRYLDEWKATMENKYFNATGKRIDLDMEEIYVFPKFDGVSVVFEMDKDGNMVRALTRGFTEANEAQDVTHIFKNFKKRNYNEFPVGQEYGFKTEVMVKNSDLEYFNKKYKTNYKNTRSIASAIITSNDYDVEKSSLLVIVPLRVGDIDGEQQIATEAFKNYPYIRCLFKDREVIRKFALEHATINNELRCDGAVIHIINPEIQRVLGRENDINNYEVAYKFTEEYAMTELLDIDFTVGLFGKITPVAHFKPVKLKGNTIENVSVGSIGRLKDLQLRKGDSIKILYDIIPYLSFDKDCSHDYSEDIIRIPNFCPECGNLLKSSETGDSLYCNNPDCPCRVKGKILNYLNKMNIKYLSYSNIDKLFNAGFVKNIQDLYSIEKNAKNIAKLDKIGSKTVQKWIDEINAKRTVYDYEMLGSIGIPNISKKIFETVCNVYTIDELFNIVDKDSEKEALMMLMRIPGFQMITARKLLAGIHYNRRIIRFLQNELNITDCKNRKTSLFTVCFTKVRDEDIEKELRQIGGEVVDSLTSKTTFLVVPNLNVQSTKVDKAKKYGIKIVPIDDIMFHATNYINHKYLSNQE